MFLQVKICGLSSQSALDAAIAGGAGHVGFVFYPPSPRAVDCNAAGGLATPARVKRVGVFVNPDDALLEQAIAAGAIDILQLHNTAPGRAAAIGAKHVREVWAAVPVRVAADLRGAARYRGAADRILYDAKTPEGALPGGMGLRFDWALLQGFDHPLPWALSGGLDAANIAEAVRVTGATTVDVSSGVEDAPGVKSVAKIAAFLQAARSL